MPVFTYRIMDATGGVQTGKIQKSSMEEAKAELAGMDAMILEIKTVSLWNMDITELGSFGKKVRKSDVALFCRQMSFLLSSGIKIIDALAMLLASSSRKSAAFREVLGAVQDDLRKGESLSDSLGRRGGFPDELPGMARMGELSGRLPQILGKMAEHYERDVRTEEELKSAMIYPVLVSVMMLGVMVIAVTFVVPNYVQLFVAGGISLPLPTRALIAVSGFARLYHVHLLLCMTVAAVVIRVFFRTPGGRYFADHIKLHLPIYRRVYIKRVNLRFVQGLSLMLDAGQPLVFSLNALKSVINNRVIGKAIDEMGVKLEEGAAFHACIREVPYFEPLLGGMAMMGEETGRLAQVLDRCGEYFQRETETMISRLNKIVDPVVTILLGLLLAFLMTAIMLPTFALTDIM